MDLTLSAIEPRRIRGISLLRMAVLVAVLVFVLVAIAACGSSTRLNGPQLARRIIPPPTGYVEDSTAGATGYIAQVTFSQFGGAGHTGKAGFLGGFRQNYVDQATQEGITVTLLQFSSAANAARYFNATESQTLSYAAPTHKAYGPIPGAQQIDGTQPYQGEYVHGVVMVKGAFYASLVYVAAGPGPAPLEMSVWSRVQYRIM